MNAFSAYLSNPKTRKILSQKPGDKGFSLIELVVVVAVLAILAAIAIPAFTSINNKARASAASNTVATLAKDCAVRFANGASGAGLNFSAITLDGYTGVTVNGSPTACDDTGNIIATSSDPALYPTFTYNIANGNKTCVYTGSESVGCSAGGRW